ncbi:MAG: FMN-binding protein [Deltaproteobacteria bacterium]|nr:FMN-binding protein [Deltaproteobacteria bacterium]
MRRLLLLLLLISYPCLMEAQTIYLKPSEALKIIFHDSKEITQEEKVLNDVQKQEIEKKIGYKLSKTAWKFYVAKSGAKIDGYAVIDSEVGKTEPITFLTTIHPDGSVKEVEILVYREPQGSEVHEKRFLKQYEKKKSTDPIRVGQDITNISGATISAHSVSNGVKRDLILWDLFYGSK